MPTVPKRYTPDSTADKGELMTFHKVISYRKDGVCEFTSSPTFPGRHNCTFCHPPAWMVGAMIQETDFDQSALDRTVLLLQFAYGSDFYLGTDVCVRQCQLRLYAVVGHSETPTTAWENLDGDKFDVCTISGVTDWAGNTCYEWRYTYSGKATYEDQGGEWGITQKGKSYREFRLTPDAPAGEGEECEFTALPDPETDGYSIGQFDIDAYLNDTDTKPVYTLSSPSSGSAAAREAVAQTKANQHLTDQLNTSRTFQSASADHVYDFFDHLNNMDGNYAGGGRTYKSGPEQEYINDEWVDEYEWQETVYSTVHVFLVAVGLKRGSYEATCVQYLDGVRGSDLTFTLTVPSDEGYAKSSSATTSTPKGSTRVIGGIPSGTAGTTCSWEEISGIPGEPDIVQALGTAAAIFSEA